jgi:hypothetical protein
MGTRGTSSFHRRHNRMDMRKLSFLLLALTLAYTQARSCEYCFISEHGYVFDMNRTLIRLDMRLQVFSGLTNSASLTDQVSTRYLSTFLTVNYATGRWGFTAVLPYVYRTQQNSFTGSPSLHYAHIGRVVSAVDSASLESQTGRGLGDVTGLIRYAVFVYSGENFASVFVQGGVKAATGAINARDAFGFLRHPHLQIGTGTTLALFGVSGSYGGVKQSFAVSLLAGMPVQVRGPFRESASVNYDAAFRFRLFPEDAEDGSMLLGQAGVVGSVRGKERYKGVDVTDSGGHYMFLNAGISFMPWPGMSLEASFQVPMIKALVGNQINEQYRFASGIQMAF